MASIRITQFGGLVPDLSARLKPETHASIAHNCLLDNGTLRPQAQWVKQSEVHAGYEEYDLHSIVYDPISDRAFAYTAYDAVLATGEPMPSRVVYGAYNKYPYVTFYHVGQGFTEKTAAVYNYGITGSVTVTPALLSKKPINRVYAASRVRILNGRREEGGLAVLMGDPLAVTYEGDTATIQLTASPMDDMATHVRIYRSISGLDTGSEVSNTFDTEWHLIDELPIHDSGGVIFVDGGSLTTDPLDVNYSQQFHPPKLEFVYFGLTESGWFIAATADGKLQASERYMPHAWPSDNMLDIHEEITDIAVHKDNVYIGTKGRPYVASLAQGERGVQLAAVPYDEHYPCLPNTMAVSASGAIYASTAGLVALGREGLQIISGGLVNPGDSFFKREIELNDGDIFISYMAGIPFTIHGAYLRGKYYGFCGAQVEFFGGGEVPD